MRIVILIMLSTAVCGIAAAAGTAQQTQPSPTQGQSKQPAPPEPKPPARLSNTYGPYPTIKWSKVGDNKAFTVYAGLPTIFRSGDVVTMWHMYDYKDAQNHDDFPFLSKQGRNEYDCKQTQTREIAYTLYAGKIGTGNVVFLSYGMDHIWEPVKRQSIEDTLLNTACNYR